MRLILLIFVVNLLSGLGFAQQITSDVVVKEETCASEIFLSDPKKFQMPIIVPSEKFDAAMIVKPDKKFDRKMEFIEPCLIQTVPGIDVTDDNTLLPPKGGFNKRHLKFIDFSVSEQ